jgi:hypothetical protein
MTWFLFVLINQAKYSHNITGTRTVYWVAWLAYRTAMQLFLAHLTQRFMWVFVITLRRSSVRTQLLKLFSSETTWPLETKLWWNGPWMIPFQNCVRQSRPPTNMVVVTKNKKGGWNLKYLHLWNYWDNWN